MPFIIEDTGGADTFDTADPTPTTTNTAAAAK
jgi:hypothetical protein